MALALRLQAMEDACGYGIETPQMQKIELQEGHFEQEYSCQYYSQQQQQQQLDD